MKTTIQRFFQVASLTGAAIFLTAASASATTVTFATSGGFNNTSNLTLNSVGGASATLTFQPQPNNTLGVPSNTNYGIFTVSCATCTTQAGFGGSIFGAFTFQLLITDVTDGATGIFGGTSTGGLVFSDVSQVTIDWFPIQLGPGTSNAASGNFGTTDFVITPSTRIVAPNSGQNDGQTTVQGTVADSTTPEPTSFGLMGAALIGLGVLKHKRSARA